MDLHLSGKTALVTGASQGLGRAIVKTLATEGVKVFATARNRDLLASLVSEIEVEGGVAPIVFEQDFVAQDGPERIRRRGAGRAGSCRHLDQ